MLGASAEFTLSPRLDQRRKLRVFRNGEYEPGGGRTLYIEEETTMPALLNMASKRLGIHGAAICFNSDGVPINDVCLIDGGDVLFFSDGEPFRVPRRTHTLQRSMSVPTNLGSSVHAVGTGQHKNSNTSGKRVEVCFACRRIGTFCHKG